MDKITERVYEVINKTLEGEKKVLTLEAKIEDICKDSIQIFGLIMAFEKEFQKKVTYEDLISIETVGDVIDYIRTNY